MAALRKKKPKPLQLGRTADAVYTLSWQILQCQKFLDKEEATWQAFIAKEPRHEDSKYWRERLDSARGLRRMFETQLVRDPAAAVAEFGIARRAMLDGDVIGDDKKAPALRAAAGRAVDHVYGWLLERAGDPVYSLPVPVLALSPIATKHPVNGTADLEQLLTHKTVQAALKGDGGDIRGGPKKAAIAIVALATGLDQQMVKRAHSRGSKRTQK